MTLNLDINWFSYLVVDVNQMEHVPETGDDLDNLVNILMSNEELKEDEVGNKFSCHLCDYRAKNKMSVKQHVESKHEGICYSCDYCSPKVQVHAKG